MKVLLTTPLRNFDGKIMKDGPGDLLLRNVLIQALSVPMPKDEPTQSVKATRFDLGVKIASSDGEVDLISDEIKILKDLVAMGYVSLIYGQVAKMLEGQPTGIEAFVEPKKAE